MVIFKRQSLGLYVLMRISRYLCWAVLLMLKQGTGLNATQAQSSSGVLEGQYFLLLPWLVKVILIFGFLTKWSCFCILSVELVYILRTL